MYNITSVAISNYYFIFCHISVNESRGTDKPVVNGTDPYNVVPAPATNPHPTNGIVHQPHVTPERTTITQHNNETRGRPCHLR